MWYQTHSSCKLVTENENEWEAAKKFADVLKLIYRHRNVDAVRTYCAALLQSVCSLGWFIYFGWFCLLSICEFCVSEAAVDFTITDRHSTTECSPAADDASLKCLLAFKKTTLTVETEAQKVKGQMKQHVRF